MKRQTLVRSVAALTLSAMISLSSVTLVFPMGEITGNIWMATLQRPK